MSQETCRHQKCNATGGVLPERFGVELSTKPDLARVSPLAPALGTTGRMAAATTIHVCVTCRSAGEPLEPKSERAGARLLTALLALADDRVSIAAVECLSVCKRPCTIGFSAAGKWTYVYGDFLPEGAPAILAAAALYALTPDGLIPWKQRPEALKKGVVARLPPLTPIPEPSA
jgi:predicted metal-binding protein